MYKSFPFDIGDIARLCDIPVKGAKGNNEYIDCPFCGKRRKMNFNYEKNQFHCVYCGKGGSMLQLYSALSGFVGTNAQIVEKIKAELGIESHYSQPQHPQSISTQKDDEIDFEKMEKCDKVYRAFLAKLSLGTLHREHLMKERFLSEASIERFMFRSVPIFGTDRIVQELEAEVTAHNLRGVPGFYREEENQRMRININPNMTGIIIPTFNFFGLIEALQIRLDRPFGKTKYKWVSSTGLPEGSGTKAIPYFVEGSSSPSTLIVTEGAFKAMIPNRIFGYNILALAGVNNQKEFEKLIKYIKGSGYTKIVEAFDSDYNFNIHVRNAKESFKQLCLNNGFQFAEWTWKPEEGKGLDDFSINFYNNKK